MPCYYHSAQKVYLSGHFRKEYRKYSHYQLLLNYYSIFKNVVSSFLGLIDCKHPNCQLAIALFLHKLVCKKFEQ